MNFIRMERDIYTTTIATTITTTKDPEDDKFLSRSK